ncbi:hypothetical protein ACHRVZ_07275 [Flavobacterium sp. FlaQc-57]|uniref:hypothetical protein n=1 Tax=Flavobacterium sp. FlaQc-57 TaxID=3374186 RepID=UPI0037574E9A
MKTISTLAKKGICNLVIFLTAIQVSYSLVSHIFYGKPQPDFLVVILCLFVSTFASLKKRELGKE